nr:hypothetical protein BaRGS_019432 [Batillaria attramentaria]
MLGFFLAILLMVVLQWIPRERKKGPSTQAKPRCFAPAQTEKNREQSHSVGATNSSSAGTQTSKSPKETVGQQITVNIHKAGPISISGSREQQTLQDGYRVDWSSNLENDTAKLKEEQERTKRDLERLSDLIKSLDHRWDPSTGTEERQTWLNERKCFCAVIDDLMKQRDQLDQKLKLMERRHQEEKAALEKEKMQREQKMVSFVLRLEEKCKQLEGKLIQLKESQLRDVVLKLKKEFDVRTLIVDCGLNVLMETPAENWESVQGHQEGIIKELAGLVRDHVPKGTEGVKWHSPAQVDHKDFLASEVMRASEEKKRDHTNALAEEKERFQSTEKTGICFGN